MLRIEEIKLSLKEDENILKEKISKIIWEKVSEIKNFKIIKKAIDSRNKRDILFVYSIDVEASIKNIKLDLIKKHRIREIENFVYEIKNPSKKVAKNPIIIWSWPAGFFCALVLAKAWLKPIVIERWKDVDNRIKDVEEFSNTWKLKTNSNIQFWEWWAGTFSDWKLYTLINDARSKFIFEELIEAWAPANILYEAKPHVWTDKLRILIKKLREKIISLGWEFRFENCLTDIIIEKNKIKEIIINEKENLETDDLILALWHSARDTFEMLYKKWLNMKVKPFAMWVRIEHDAKLINKSQFWESYTNPKLWTASYKLVNHNNDARPIYTFCMCPGWFVVPASSENWRLCINWMSEYAQDSWISNSAILVPVNEADFWSDNPLAWMEFQRYWEEKAFIAWWSDYKAPAQLVWDFLNWKKSTKLWQINSTYKPGIKLTSLEECLPDFIVKALKIWLPELDKKISWFASNDAIITAIEARSSSPLKFERNEKSESNIIWIYPTWEWAWYAWWITSRAIDWLNTAEKIIEKYL